MFGLGFSIVPLVVIEPTLRAAETAVRAQMFGLDFEKIPPQFQWIAVLGALLYGAWMMRKGLIDPKPAEEVAKIAMELADAKLRQDLHDAIRLTREGLEQQIRQLAASVRSELKDVSDHASTARAGIYERINGIEREIRTLHIDVGVMKERPGPRR